MDNSQSASVNADAAMAHAEEASKGMMGMAQDAAHDATQSVQNAAQSASQAAEEAAGGQMQMRAEQSVEAVKDAASQ